MAEDRSSPFAEDSHSDLVGAELGDGAAEEEVVAQSQAVAVHCKATSLETAPWASDHCHRRCLQAKDCFGTYWTSIAVAAGDDDAVARRRTCLDTVRCNCVAFSVDCIGLDRSSLPRRCRPVSPCPGKARNSRMLAVEEVVDRLSVGVGAWALGIVAGLKRSPAASWDTFAVN